MARGDFIKPTLPKELLDKVDPGASNARKGKTHVAGRKEQRKHVREQKKTARRPQQQKPRQQQRTFNKVERKPVVVEESESDADDDDEEPIESPSKRRRLSPERTAPEIKARDVPRAIRDKLDKDAAEIARLEKKLGIRGKKRSKASGEDGLADLLAGIDDAMGLGSDDEEMDQDRSWLALKRSKAGGDERDDSEREDDDELDIDNDSELDDEMLDEAESVGILDEDMDEEEDEFSGFEVEDSGSEVEEAPQVRVRENPYRAPVQQSDVPASTKYVPPSKRLEASSDTEIVTRIKRQLQGLLNRLSEANLLSILKDVETVLNNNARQYVISSLIDLLMALLCDRTILLDTFIILHAGFITALYKVIGSHFGAQFLERFVTDFLRFYEPQKQSSSLNGDVPGTKEPSNLIALLADLYSFQMITSQIVYDHLKLLLIDLSDLNAELLLRLIKSCGPQLRKENPAALKDVIMLMQKCIAEKGDATLPVRIKFMVEMIMNLKNNKVKNIGSAVATEAVIRMKKNLGSLNTRAKATEPLGFGLKDVQNADKSGKWWLVGASWSTAENEPVAMEPSKDDDDEPIDMADELATTETSTADLLQIAKQHRMNTDILRTIFVTVMSASDYKDAYQRLRKIKLNKAQQYNIPRVLVRCAGLEEAYNPYYRLVAEKLCEEHKFRMGFQFNLWGVFRRLGEKEAMSEHEAVSDQSNEDVTLRETVNMAKMYGEMVASSALSITILKVISISLFRAQELTTAGSQLHVPPKQDKNPDRIAPDHCIREDR